MAGEFELFMNENKEFRFLLRSDTGRVIVTSLCYKTKTDCLDGIEWFREKACSTGKNYTNGWVYEIIKDKEKEYLFLLKTEKGKIIAKSGSYWTKTGCKNGIASVKKNTPAAKIIDMTIS